LNCITQSVIGWDYRIEGFFVSNGNLPQIVINIDYKKDEVQLIA